MADDKAKTAPQDLQRVNVNEDYEVQYWTKKFGCTGALKGCRKEGWCHGEGRRDGIEAPVTGL
jgi:hypothetical protein